MHARTASTTHALSPPLAMAETVQQATSTHGELASSVMIPPTGTSSHTVHFGTFRGGKRSWFKEILYVHPDRCRSSLTSPTRSFLPAVSPAFRATPLPPELTALATAFIAALLLLLSLLLSVEASCWTAGGAAAAGVYGHPEAWPV